MPSPLPLLFNWAALVAICAIPYLRLRHHFGLETAEPMKWSLVAVGAFGTVGILCTAWQASRERASRASHGLRARHTN